MSPFILPHVVVNSNQLIFPTWTNSEESLRVSYEAPKTTKESYSNLYDLCTIVQVICLRQHPSEYLREMHEDSQKQSS